MLSSCLHPHGGKDPDRLVEIELLPFRLENLTGAGRREDREFERQRAGFSPLTKTPSPPFP